MKILVADDDPISTRLMQRMLERSGYEVVLASDGRAAAEQLLSESGPRLALIDWMMPELDGPAVCRAMRRQQDSPYIYIVLLTSKESHADIVEGLEAGADDYLTKPCNAAELKARLLTGRRIIELEEKLIEAREGMRFRAMHDGLTRLLNRTAILAHMRESLQRSHRDDVPVSILLCDIDHFKRINDEHGHLTGDAVLELFAARLRNAIRGGDAIGRYGGEEFLVILDGCDAPDVLMRAEQIRRAIAEESFNAAGHSVSVSASIGGTTVNRHNQPSAAEAVIDQADVALYQAKADGRNCVRIAIASPAASPLAPSLEAAPVSLPLDPCDAVLASATQS